MRATLLAVGVAARYGEPLYVDGEYQILRPGAFARSLCGPVDACVNHFTGAISSIGRREDGSLQLWEDARALRFALSVETPAARRWDVVNELRGGPLAASVRFRVAADDTRAVGFDRFAIDRATLLEVSLLSRFRRPVDPGAFAALELGCSACWSRGQARAVRRTSDGGHRCESCGQRHTH